MLTENPIPTSTHSPPKIPVIQPLPFLHIPRGYYRFSNPQNWTDEGNTFGRGWEYSEANGISQRLLGLARDFHPLDSAHAERTEKVRASTPDGFGCRGGTFRVCKRKRLRQSAGHYGTVQCFLGVFEKR